MPTSRNALDDLPDDAMPATIASGDRTDNHAATGSGGKETRQ